MSSSFARQIVRDALRVHDQELVWIHTWDHTMDLAQEILQQAHLHGASVVLSVVSEASVTHQLKKAPLEAVTTPARHLFSGVSKANVLIVLDGPENPAIFRTVDKGKALAVTSTLIRLLDTGFSNRVRTVHVRTTAFTEQAAKNYGISHSKLMQESNRCLTMNQAKMLDLGHRIEVLLQKHREIHLSSSEGTDLRFRTRGSSLIDDGIIDQSDLRSKNVITQLPAGTISIPIDESSAEGTIVITWPRAFLGDTIENLRMDFKKGEITDLRAHKGEKTLKRALREGSEKSDHLTRLIFGINSQASTPLGQPLDVLIPGTITLGLGDNTAIGGRVRSNFSYEHTLNEAIVSIGPTAVIMDGKLTF
jgi:leucyl aminopeptidase (aminopeptidase T)